MRGRIPTPKPLNDLRGDPGRRRRYEKEPPAPDGVPICPDHLDPLAKQEWVEITTLLADMNLLSKADRAMIEVYCVSYSRWRRALERVQQVGEVILDKTKGKMMTNPYAHVANRMQEEMRKLLIEFGLSPAARSRVRAVEKKPEDKWAKLRMIQ